MQNLIGYFSPSLEQLVGLAALLAVCVCITLIGGAISARKRLRELDLVAGWSLVSLLFVIAGGGLGQDFRLIAGTLVVVVIVAGFVHARRTGPIISGDLGRAVVLALPMIWLAGCMMMSQWDDFTHWMVNARYVFDYNTLPGAGNPPSASTYPGYPHGLAYVVYLSSQLVGFLTENATPVFNILMLASLAVLVGRVIQTTLTGQSPKTGTSSPVDGKIASAPVEKVGWVFCAIGALTVTALNPTFVPKIVFTSYADTPTAVLVGMLCIIMWLLLGALAGEDNRHPPTSLAWSFGLVAMASISIKQPNVVLFGLVMIGGLWVAIRDPNISLYRLIRLLPAMVLPPLIIYLGWRLHISVNEVSGEFQFLPQADWLTDQISVVVGKMALVASKKGGYFSVMLIACILAARALWRIRSPLDRLSTIVAVLFVGYNVFLLFVYVTAFGANGLVAPSYWRFNMHLGGACVGFAAYGLALLWRNRVTWKPRRSYAWVAYALIVATPFALAHKIRFDQYAPKIFVRAVAEEIVDTIPKGVRFVSFDVTTVGDFEVIARYAIAPHVVYAGYMLPHHQPTTENVTKFIASRRPEFAWIHVPTEALETVTRLKLPPRHSYLIQNEPSGWKVVKAWPFPGYDDPNTAPK